MANNGFLLLMVCALIVIGIVAFSRCKLSCGAKREGLSHRLTTTRLLLDNAYGKKPLPDYSENWPMVLNAPASSREHYHDVRTCQEKCRYAAGNTRHNKCIVNCITANLSGYSDSQACMDGSDCRSGEICVSPSYYGGGKHGMCMNANEPGVPRREHYTENFGRARTCRPSKFYNEVVGQCQPRWQGVSSAKYIRRESPGPEPRVSIPGSVRPGYGVGWTDPVDLPVNFVLETDQ